MRGAEELLFVAYLWGEEAWATLGIATTSQDAVLSAAPPLKTTYYFTFHVHNRLAGILLIAHETVHEDIKHFIKSIPSDVLVICRSS